MLGKLHLYGTTIKILDLICFLVLETSVDNRKGASLKCSERGEGQVKGGGNLMDGVK